MSDTIKVFVALVMILLGIIIGYDCYQSGYYAGCERQRVFDRTLNESEIKWLSKEDYHCVIQEIDGVRYEIRAVVEK